MSNKDILKDYDDDFRDAPNPDMGAPLPDGEYEASLIGWKLKEHESYDPMFVFQFEIEDPDYHGKWIWASYGLGKDRIKWLKGAVSKLGFDPIPLLSELPEYLDDCIGWRFKVRLKTNIGKNGREFQNVNILMRLVMDAEAGTGLPEDMTPDGLDDDIPF